MLRTSTLATLLFLATLSASAENFSLQVSRTEGRAGGFAEVEVGLLPGAGGIGALVFALEYDESRLAFENAVEEEAGAHRRSPTATIVPQDGIGHIGVAVYDRAGPVRRMQEGVITRVRFRILPDASGFAYVRIASSPAPNAASPDGKLTFYISAPPAEGGIAITSEESQLRLSPTPLELGSIVVGREATRRLLLSNLGGKPLTIRRLELHGDREFSLSQPHDGAWSLLAGQTVSVPVRFSSPQAARYTATIAVIGEHDTPIGVAMVGASAMVAGSYSYDTLSVVPVIARAAGPSGSIWKSSLTLHNASQETASARLTFVFDDGRALREFFVDLEPLHTRSYPDFAAEALGLATASGTLFVEASTPLLDVRSESYNERPSGERLGQSVSAIDAARRFATGEIVVLTDLNRTSESRSNIALVNLGTTEAKMRVTLLSQAGEVLGSADHDVPPLSALRRVELLDHHAGVGLVAHIEALSENAVFFAYASTLDIASGAPLFQPAR